MENAYNEYVTFEVTAKDGTVVEMAVVDEFDFEGRHYILAAEIHDDQVSDGAYLCRGKEEADGFVVERIETRAEYERAAKAYEALRS